MMKLSVAVLSVFYWPLQPSEKTLMNDSEKRKMTFYHVKGEI